MTIQSNLCVFLQLACTASAFVSSPKTHHSLSNSRLAFAPSIKSAPSKTRLYEYIPYEDRDAANDADMDWRQFRAKLVLEEHGIERANEQQHQQWAYLQEHLEPGAVLVHDDYSNKILSNPYLYKSVLLVLQVDPKHTTCLILNRLASVTMHEDTFQATLFYGGKQDSFHEDENQRIFCIHRCADCADVSDEIMSGLFLCSLEDAKMLHDAKRAQPADFLYISGYETLDTKDLRHGIEVDKSWKSITIDAMTLQHALYQGSLDANAVHTHLLSMIGLRPAPSEHGNIENYNGDPNHTFIGDQTTSMEDALLREWQATQLHHGPARTKHASHPPHDIKEGDLLRASSQDHAFLFENLEFHKSIVLILEANEDTCVAALLSYPTVETEPMLFGLPIRHGGSDSEATYVLHYLGDRVGGKQVGTHGTFYMCTVEQAASALDRGIAQRHEFMVLRGKKVFDRQGAALDIVSPDLAPDIFSMLNQQQPLDPLVVDQNVHVAREAWRLAGGKDGKEELRQLGEQATKAWVASHLLSNGENEENANGFYNDFGPGGLRP